MQNKWGLIWPLLLMIVLPLAASWFAYPHTHLPPYFGEFPPWRGETPPGFNRNVFILVLLAELVVAALLVFPQWFGFKQVSPKPAATPVALPKWFWIGAAVMLFFWWLMWTGDMSFGALVYYAFTPLWWGFILMLDGIVYRRSSGYSLLASRPKTLLISILVSVLGWCLFEYFNYFALGNWLYPNSHGKVPLSHPTVVVLFLVAYTTVWPAVFEWYTLLNTFPKFVARYAQGPKLVLPGNALLWGGLLMIAVMVFFPYPLFWVLWIGTLAVFSGLLIKLGIPTPFTSLAQGDWSPMILMALSSLFNGFVWEVWNWGSVHLHTAITNPNYWVYDIPYVNIIHIYAEMPLLGFAGYLPFGIMVWVVFIWAGKLFGFNTRLLKD